MLDEAVQKILLFKDLKETEHKAYNDTKVAENQSYIKDTIS